MYKVVKLLAASLGASFSLQPPADRQWGAIKIKGFLPPPVITVISSQSFIFTDGKKFWDGMMGLVYDDKVDAAVGTIFYLKVVNIRIAKYTFEKISSRIECPSQSLTFPL